MSNAFKALYASRHNSIGCLAAGILAAYPVAAFAKPEIETPTTVPVLNRDQIDSLPLGRDMQRILDLHNAARAEVGSPPLRWNPALAQGAQEWAEVQARSGAFEHSPYEVRMRGNFAENLSLGPRSSISPPAVAQTWFDESRFFHPGAFPNVFCGRLPHCKCKIDALALVGCRLLSGLFVQSAVTAGPDGVREPVPILQFRL